MISDEILFTEETNIGSTSSRSPAENLFERLGSLLSYECRVDGRSVLPRQEARQYREYFASSCKCFRTFRFMMPLPGMERVEASLEIILVDLRIYLRGVERLVAEDHLNVAHVAPGAE